MKTFVAVLVSMCVCVPAYADALVAKGTKVTLSVEYVYASTGKTQDVNDLHEWRVNRGVKVTAELTADVATALPVLHAMEADQKAGIAQMQTKAAGVATKMAPMMADIEKFMAKCGDDEACMEREIANYGMNTKMTPELKSAKQDVQSLSKQGEARYQMWSATAQQGSYSVDETRHSVLADPGCMPSMHCTRDESRKGAGVLPLPPSAKPNGKNEPKAATGFALIEVDTVKNTLMMKLPVPLMPLPYTQTIKTNNPEEKSGVSQQLLSFARLDDKPIAAALKGDVRQQSGEQVIKLAGARGDGGTLTVKWRFSAQ